MNEIVEKVLKAGKKVNLDVGCGPFKNKGCVGLDKRDIDGVDIVHDLEVFPYPLPDESCKVVLAAQILEHIKPWFTIDFMNEIWRLLIPDGELVIATPYAGTKEYWKDPTHCNGCIPETFDYFDPRFPMYGYYSPKPWKIRENYPRRENNHLFCLMEKIDVKE